jgi:stage V sporulation protein G
MKILHLNKLNSERGGKKLAFFDIETDDGIIIKGFSIIDGSKGKFVACPDEKGKDGKYYERVILPAELKTKVEKMALEEYDRT